MGYAMESGGLTEWAVALPCGMAALLTPFLVVPWRDMVTVQEANLGWVCTWHTHPAGMDPREWQAKAVMTYLSWSLPAAPGAWAQWWDRALSWARDGNAVAACPDLPREPVSVQPWTVSLHLPTVAAGLAAKDPEVLLLGDREGPGFRLGRGLEVRTARLPCPVDRDILDGLQFTRADGADAWTAVHCRLPDAWPQVFRPPGQERLVGLEWRVWATNSTCPPEVVLPRRTSHPSWETVTVLWGWVAVHRAGGHVLTGPRGTVIETDGGMALQLAAEPLTTHVVVAVLQWGADRPQPWRDPVAGAVWRDLPLLRAAVWPGGAGRHLPGALPWLRDCGNASPPPAELRGALEHLEHRRQLWGAVMVQGHHGVQVAVQTRRDPDLVRRVNAHIRSVLPQLTYTALAVVHGVGDHPILVHTHPKDDSPLTGEIALGDFVGGGLFTSALLCANGPSRPAWIRWGRDLLWGHIVDPRYGVMFNASRPHMPLAWSGQRIVLVPYTGIAWGRLPVAMQNEVVTFGFPR